MLFRADEGCLQWFTGQGGRVQSFNNLDLNGIMIENLLYTICIRNEEGTIPCSFNPKQAKGGRNQDAACLEALPVQ